jgi:hypothetical protein
MAHSRFAPSASPRVTRCPASLLLNETEPDRPSVEAAEGTAAHYIGQLCLKNRCKVEKYAGCVVGVMLSGEEYFVHENAPAPAEGEGWAFEVDDEMIVAVQDYVDRCNALPGKHYVEIRVDISHLCPEPNQKGTSDHIALDLDSSPKRMYVTDLKYGKGVQVFAEENEQAINYASGALREFDTFDEVEEIVVRISQPRLDHFDEWIVPRAEFEKYENYIRERNALALSDNPPFGPSEKACRFCKVQARCRALNDFLHTKAAFAFDDLDEDFVTPDPRLLSDEELVEAWRMTALISARATAIAKEMIRLMLQGHDMPTVHLAESRTHRQFANKRDAEMFLKWDCDLDEDQVYKKKMISPNQAMKLIPKPLREELAGMLFKPPGKPCIVDAKSNRPRYVATGLVDVDALFSDLDEDEDS